MIQQPRRRRVWTLAAATAASTALLGIPAKNALARLGSIDVPNHRSSHRVPTPRGGGVAALLGATTAMVVTRRRPSAARSAAIVSLAGLGLVDDLTGHIPARHRLAAQIAFGGAALSHGGWDRPLSGVATAGIVNAFNFMDGINGISALTAITWGINATRLSDESGRDLTTLGALVTGAGLGFLPHNLPSGRLFLGDVGSYGFGAAMAAGILSQRTPLGRYRAAAPLLLYATDVAHTLNLRVQAGKRLGEPHREHTYQRLVAAGLTHTQVALLHAATAGAISWASRGGTAGVLVTMVSMIAYVSSPRVIQLIAAWHPAPPERRGMST